MARARKPDRQGERNRRRFARRQWRRRWLAWRYLAVAAAVVVLLGVGVYAVGFSSWLAVDDVEVSGTDLLSVSEVRRVADVPDGRPLARLDLASIRARVAALAEVRDVEVTRHWPHGVDITVTERTPIAVVRIAGQLQGLDDQGVVFRDYRTVPPGLPLVEAAQGATADALAQAAAVVGALPSELAASVDHLDLAGEDDISLDLRDGRTVVWGNSADSAQKATVLAALLADTDAQVYDVSVPGFPTTR